jgi:hypothetical protein
MDELFVEKLKVVLNLIRTNNTGDDALKITQAADNLVRAWRGFTLPEPEQKTVKKSGTGA